MRERRVEVKTSYSWREYAKSESSGDFHPIHYRTRVELEIVGPPVQYHELHDISPQGNELRATGGRSVVEGCTQLFSLTCRSWMQHAERAYAEVCICSDALANFLRGAHHIPELLYRAEHFWYIAIVVGTFFVRSEVCNNFDGIFKRPNLFDVVGVYAGCGKYDLQTTRGPKQAVHQHATHEQAAIVSMKLQAVR